LRKFQHGYSERDVDKLDEFLELFTDRAELEVIGTGAVILGDREWCVGKDAARQLIEDDWLHWGDVLLDVEGARIRSSGEVGWLATAGTITHTKPPEERAANFLRYVRRSLEADDGADAEERLLDILRGGSKTLYATRQSVQYVWPFRLTAVVTELDQAWYFEQVHFAFPTSHFPDVRWVGEEIGMSGPRTKES
jgi:hypothetical protein